MANRQNIRVSFTPRQAEFFASCVESGRYQARSLNPPLIGHTNEELDPPGHTFRSTSGTTAASSRR
jgi:hypothetical protein